MKVVLDDVITNSVEARGRHPSRKQQLLRCPALVRLNLEPIMVCPHEGELEAVVVGCVKESDIDGPVEEWAVVVVVVPIVGGP